MSDSWDDFESAPAKEKIRRNDKQSDNAQRSSPQELESKNLGCSWGQLETDDRPSAAARYGKHAGDDLTDAQDFITTYEKYLADKKSIPQQTTNYKNYSKNPQKYLNDWLEHEGHDELIRSTAQASESQYVCSIDIPVDDQDFTLTSESHARKKGAIDEVCLDACRMLDSCGKLIIPARTDQEGDEAEDPDRKRRIGEANKEDDIEFDGTSKRHCTDAGLGRPATTDSKVNTYESLMAKWTAVNMSILQLKSQLVRLDLSVTKHIKRLENDGERLNEGAEDDGDEDDEVDPLDAFMSNLETKTALSMDDKIEKSRLKVQIAAQERELSKLSRMIELAKPASSKRP